MLGFDAVAQMALSDGTATSRFSNWSQHLDFGLFKVLAKQPTATALDLDLGTEPDKVLWEASKDNPFQWPKIRKGIHTVVPMFHVLICSIAATTITASAKHFGHDFHVTPFIADLPYALYILGLAMGFLVGAITSESMSRKYSMLISLAIFALSEMGVGLANNIIIIICLRFFAGLGGGMGTLIGACILFDMYPRNHRTIPHLILCGSFFLGPVAGPLIGTYITQLKSWQWAEIGVAIVTAPLIILLSLTKETCHWRIGNSKDIVVEKLSVKTSNLNLVHVIFMDLNIICLGLWMGVIFGIQYAFYSTIPDQFGMAYHLDWLPQNLSFLALGLGSMIGIVAHLLFQTQILSSLTNLWHAKRSSNYSTDPAPSVPPRYHLLGALPITIVLPMLTIFFVFTVLSDSTVFISLAILVLISICSSLAFLSGLGYLAETFNEISEATIVGAYFFIALSAAGGILIASGGCMGPLGFKSSFGIFTAAMALLGLPIWGLWWWNKRSQG